MIGVAALSPVLAADGIPMGWLIGGIFAFTAVLDVFLAVFVVAPRVKDDRQRAIVYITFAFSTVLFLVVGALFAFGIIGPGNS